MCNLLISALCSVVIFCGGLYLLQREAALTRGGSCTYRCVGVYKDKSLSGGAKFRR